VAFIAAILPRLALPGFGARGELLPGRKKPGAIDPGSAAAHREARVANYDLSDSRCESTRFVRARLAVLLLDVDALDVDARDVDARDVDARVARNVRDVVWSPLFSELWRHEPPLQRRSRSPPPKRNDPTIAGEP
jgi:hypothetical protein